MGIAAQERTEDAGGCGEIIPETGVNEVGRVGHLGDLVNAAK